MHTDTDRPSYTGSTHAALNGDKPNNVHYHTGFECGAL